MPRVEALQAEQKREFKREPGIMNGVERKQRRAINTQTAWLPILRPIGRLLVAAQLALVLQPLSVLAQEKGQAPYNPQAQAQLQRFRALQQDVERAKIASAQASSGAGFRVSQRLARANELVRSLQSEATGQSLAPGKKRQAMPEAQKNGQYLALRTALDAVEDDAESALSEFDATRAELVAKRLPAEILQRHDQAAQAMRERAQAFKQYARSFKQSPGTAELANLASFFEQFPATRKQAPIEAGKLPWRTPEPNKRMPAETKAAWHQNLYGDQKVRLAQAGSVGPIHFDVPPEPGVAPTTADLVETDEVQLTPGIRAKATELGNNPVQIYNWVRNNVDFAPTNGAIQSAQDTLDKKRGNATDTASLLIALLRAANVPARYQWGTVDIPVAQAMNWVGGATKPEAVLQILNQGGIAARGISSGGQFATVRMEHVWVNAYVNWAPSRGSRNATATQHPNPNGNLNSWVPLDASYKQFLYSEGLSLRTQVPLNANALLAAAQTGATVNEAEGWVRNINQAGIESHINAYRNQLKSYINSSTSGESIKVGDVIGKKIIPVQAASLLAGAVAYPVMQRGIEAVAVPSGLQHKFTYQLFASDNDKANDSPMLSFTEKTSKLAGKRLTLSYIPASQLDANIIDSYLPTPHSDGTPILESELPSSLPGYLIQVIAQIRLDGQPIVTSTLSVPLGTDLYGTGGFTQLRDTTQWDLTHEESNVAGQYTAIGISAGGVSSNQLAEIKQRLLETRSKLSVRETAAITSEHLSGDLLLTVIWSWFALAEYHNLSMQGAAGVIETPGLSYGLFHAAANAVYSWGVIRSVNFPGVNMDISHARNLTWSKDNSESNWIAYNRLRGQFLSSLEHAIPERFFNDAAQCNLPGASTPNPALQACPQGMSAVKAIATAAQSGQKVYTITQSVFAANPGIINSALASHSNSTKDRIQQALVAGYEVTVHEGPIAQDGWTGAGFIMIDPQTGAGGYLIEGGTNGGWLQIIIAALSGLVDALTKKLRNPDATNGPLNELSRSKWLNLLAKVASIVSFVDSIVSIVKDDSLSTPKKIAQITFTLAFSVAAMEGAAALGIFFASPVTGMVLAISLGVALAFLLLELNAAIAEL